MLQEKERPLRKFRRNLKIPLKCMPENVVLESGLHSTGSGQCPMSGSCTQGSEYSRGTEGADFLTSA